MNLDQLTKIGTIKRAHGLKGELKVIIDSFYFNDVQSLTALFIKKGDAFLPFFIAEFQPQASQTILKFEDIQSKEEASQYIGKSLFVESKKLSQIKKDVRAELIGLQLLDAHGTPMGEIIEVDEMQTQYLLKVKYNNKEVLVPYHKEMLIEQSKKTLQLKIPEGLFTL